MKRIIVAPDSFKESLDASQAAEAIADGFKRVFPDLDIVKFPMSDGGEGLVRSLAAVSGGRQLKCRVTGPLGTPVDAFLGLLSEGAICVIEMAAASGLPLVPPEQRNPFLTTTYGTGELIKCALNTGCKKIIVGIGGSATNDGGAGMAQALGARLLSGTGKEIALGAKGLRELSSVEVGGLDERLKDVEIVVAVDVKNPLCGPSGASYVYAPQKGATPEMLPVLDQILHNFAEVIKRDIGKDVKDIPGAGAAGGLGAGLVAFLGADMRPGVEVVLEVVNMEKALQEGADLVVTGEGQLNRQTTFGKVPVGVAKLAKNYNVPVLALVGSLGDGAELVLAHGIDAYFSTIPRPMSLSDAMTEARGNLADTAEQCARVIKMCQP
ncbi:MAG: glycerate kinase [Dethiobacter sp.]|jgi:glycerate kinase|nr:glycerate kinase [Dethiobacter sp.]